MRHTYIKKLFAIDLKLKFSWESCSFFAASLSSQPLPELPREGDPGGLLPPRAADCSCYHDWAPIAHQIPHKQQGGQSPSVQHCRWEHGGSERRNNSPNFCRWEQLAPCSTQVRHSSQRSMQKVSSNPFNKSTRNGSWTHFTDKELKSHR